MAAIITTTEAKALRNFGAKVDDTKLTEAIDEAQRVELKKAFGDFAIDIELNKDEVSYADLMDGSTYTIGNYSFIQEGIKSLLADFTYARYLEKMKVNVTAFGVVRKNTEDGEAVGFKDIDALITKTVQDADVKTENIQKYLVETRTSTLFDRYGYNSSTDVSNIGNRRYKIV